MATSTIEKTTIKTHKLRTKKNFNQIPNWLSFKIFNAKKATERLAWATLAYLNSLPDWIDITPDYLIEKSANSKTAIYDAFAYLEKMGHLLRVKYRDEKGRIISTEYNFYLKKNGWTTTSGNPEVDDIINKNNQNDKPVKNKPTDNKPSQDRTISGNPEVVENKPKNENSYNARARACDQYRSNNNSNSNNGAENSGTDPGETADATILLEIEFELENSPTFDDDLVNQSLKLFGPKYTLEAIKVSKGKSELNPGGYFRGAATKKYQWIEDLSNQPPPTPYSTMSECNIQGYRTDFLDILFRTQDKDFQHFLDLSDDELAKEDRFKKYLESKGYQL